MEKRHSSIVAILTLAIAVSVFAQSASKGPVMVIHHAKGTFDIKMTPTPADDYADGNSLGRVAADKQYHGDLEGSGKGQMLTATGQVRARPSMSRRNASTGNSAAVAERSCSRIAAS
jgi:hypothetical protein